VDGDETAEETAETEGGVVGVAMVEVMEAFACSVDDSRVERPSVSSPLGEMLLDWARRSRSSRRRFSFLR